jgi:hypothetical protein
VKYYRTPSNGAIGSIGIRGVTAGTMGLVRGGGSGKFGGGITIVGGIMTCAVPVG